MQRGQLQEPLEDTLSEAALEDNTKLGVDALQLNSNLRLFLPGDLDGKVLDDGAGLSPDTTIDTQHKRGEVNPMVKSPQHISYTLWKQKNLVDIVNFPDLSKEIEGGRT